MKTKGYAISGMIPIVVLVGCSPSTVFEEQCAVEHCTIEAAHKAISVCQESYEGLLKQNLPDQIEMAHIDVFADGYVLALTRGDSPRLGEYNPNYHPYVVCVLTDDYVMHELLYSHGSKFFEEGIRHADYDPVASQQRRPFVDFVFRRVGKDFEFLEARPIPEDW